jgi:AcrR family transcriptional regulator
MIQRAKQAGVRGIGLRERKKQAVREALSAAAMQLAIQRGIDNVLVEDIAAEAGVALRTFRNYFSSKYEAMCAPGADRAQIIGDALRQRPASEPLWESITAAVLDHYVGSDVAPDRQWLTALRLISSSPALQGEQLKTNAIKQHILANAIAERTGLDAEHDMLPEVLAGAVVAASQVAIRRWCDADPPQPLRPLLQHALRQLAALFVAPGRSAREVTVSAVQRPAISTPSAS